MKSGFILLDVLLSLAISGLLSGILFVSVNQITQSSRSLDDVMSVHARADLVIRQLERDIAGVMVPHVEIKKVFFSSMKDNVFELVTFITNNPLQQPLQSGTSAVKIARIIYRLVPDTTIGKKLPKQYILTRQESTDLNYDLLVQDKEKQEHTSRAYEVIDGIHAFSLSYKAHKSDNKKQATPEKKEKMEKVWDSDSKIDGRDRAADERIPELVECKIAFMDQRKIKHTFFLQIPIVSAKKGSIAS